MKRTVIYFLLLFTLTLGLCACAKNSDDIITDDSSQSIISDERNGNTENNEENKIKKESQEKDTTKLPAETPEATQSAGTQQEYTIDGTKLMDGQEVPVNVTLKIAGIQKGEEADAYLSGKTPEKSISPDMEYIIVTLGITYNAGDLDEIYMEANDGTLPSAKLKFTLSNGDSNAEDIPHFYRVL